MRLYPSRRSVSTLLHHQRRRRLRARRLWRVGLGVLGIGLLLVGGGVTLRRAHQPVRPAVGPAPPAGTPIPGPAPAEQLWGLYAADFGGTRRFMRSRTQASRAFGSQCGGSQ